MENTGSPEDGTGIKNSTASAGKLQIRMTHFITYALKSAKYQENLPPKDMPAKFLPDLPSSLGKGKGETNSSKSCTLQKRKLFRKLCYIHININTKAK